ncbi:MAG: 2-amino-4-hydroxy-6-hydroxymethyldihydropteridine diphosphokinase [Bacteroidales bacterium]|nr:2-amino-4-hydroxy-6-hydroxymethyldihydropteridine diphosphokinase [Bacteroidales bacterium]
MADRDLYKVVLLFGSNLPLGRMSPSQIIEEACKEVIDALLPDYLEVGSLEDAVSATEIHQTEPVGDFEKQTGEDGAEIPVPVFYNRAMTCLTYLAPEEVLAQTQRIEKLFGRMRTLKEQTAGVKEDDSKKRVYKSRTLDIDILKVYKNIRADKTADKGADKSGEWVEIKSNTPRLVLPHHQVKSRPFVGELLKELTALTLKK